MTINGEFIPYCTKMTIYSFLLARGLDPERVAVERNREIVPRALFAQQAVLPDDVLEIVQFVGGG